MSRLVDDMLLLTRADQDDFLRRAPIDLPGYVADLWETTTTAHDRQFELGTVPDVLLDADPDRLAQALRNLIENAIAHTEVQSGHVALSTTLPAPGRVRFTVTDDGPGIPADQRELVFDRFHRTDSGRDRNSGGAGLGLAIVQAIATAHHGTVRVAASELGARLELELPGSATPRQPGRVTPEATLTTR